MRRAVLIVLDSVGIGGAGDAAAFGDEGADTLGHIAEACADGRADRAGLRAGPLRLPNLLRRGLGLAAADARGAVLRLPGCCAPTTGRWGHGAERSRGKDTVSGHWEIAGVPVPFDWGYFPDIIPSFPQELTDQLVERSGISGILGNCHASGTAIIERLGEEHLRTGRPICYTSADSVFQIAAHEIFFGLDRLYQVSEIARELVDGYRIGRVIARPFTGARAGDFTRTANRRDYAVPPPEPTLLDRLIDNRRRVVGIGKIADIFAHRGISEAIKTASNDKGIDEIITCMDGLGDGDLVFANLVDFDSLYGHRRDVAGYAAALEAFDRRLPEIEARLRPGDMAIITADHGNDPTFRGTDHTREQVPILVFGPGIDGGSIGQRQTLADIGETVAAHLGLEPGRHGTPF